MFNIAVRYKESLAQVIFASAVVWVVATILSGVVLSLVGVFVFNVEFSFAALTDTNIIAASILLGLGKTISVLVKATSKG